MKKKDAIQLLVAFVIFAAGWYVVSWEIGLAMELVFYIGACVEGILNDEE